MRSDLPAREKLHEAKKLVLRALLMFCMQRGHALDKRIHLAELTRWNIAEEHLSQAPA